MVVVVYKKSEKNAFSVECTVDTKVSVLLTQFIEINNLRVYLDRLIWSVEELANKGVLKPAELQGVSWDDFQKHQKQFQNLSQEILAYGHKPIPEPPCRYVPDKHNQRFGIILAPETQQIMLSAVSKAKQALQFRPAELTNKQALVDAIEGIRQAVMEAYPGYIQLPPWEPSLLMLEQKVELQILETENYEVFDERASLWWAGKEMEKGKAVGEYFGKNEKSKVIVKVQKWGGQQPLREPPVDAETYQKMVKYYYRKVEETKEMQKNSVESHYEKVEAADLKAKLHMPEEVRYRPF